MISAGQPRQWRDGRRRGEPGITSVGNTVSGNWSNGVLVNGGTTNDIQVSYNVIGTIEGGGLLIGNGGSGIVLNATVGDYVAGNYLWKNGGWGILAEGGSRLRTST